MDNFAEKRGIHLQKIPPLHPQSNPAETFMRPLGKTMKIAHSTGMREDEALRMLLKNYRDTPHSSTGISPSSMLFRDGERSVFPRVSATSTDIEHARERELQQKKSAQEKVNSGKFRIHSDFAPGDQVLIRNYLKTSKFEPTFLPEPFVILDVSNNGQCLTLGRIADGGTLRRHPDDVKLFQDPTPQYDNNNDEEVVSEREVLKRYIDKLSQALHDYDDNIDNHIQIQPNIRPRRERRANPRFYNQDFVNMLYKC